MTLQEWIDKGKPLNSFLNCDCMDLMKQMPDKFIDLCIVDPPYGIGGDALHTDRSLKGAGKLKNRAINIFQTKWDVSPTNDYFNELFRISKNQIIWGGNYFDLGRTRGFIVWDKVQPWENFSQVEYAWSSFECPSSLYKFDSKRDKTERIHPTQKPIALYRWLLQRYAKLGDKVFDSHVGSASSLIACHLEGFEYVGCELDADYYKSASERLEKETNLKAYLQRKKEEIKKEKNFFIRK